MAVPWIISASADNTIKIWDPATSQCISTLEGHTQTVNDLAWSPTVQSLASASDDTTVKIWNLATGKSISTLEGHIGGARGLAWSPDGRQLAASDDGAITVWDTVESRIAVSINSDGHQINSVAWSSDGTKLISPSDDHNLKTWDSATGQCISTLEGHESTGGGCTVWSPDAVSLALRANDESTIIVWDEATGKCILNLEGHSDSVTCIAWSPDTLRLASGANDNTIKIWDTSSGECTLTLKHPAVARVSWSPDAAWLVSVSRDNSIKVWASATGQCLSTLIGHNGPVTSVIIVENTRNQPISRYESLLPCINGEKASSSETDSPTLVASCSGDKTVKIWNSDTGSCTATLLGHNDLVQTVAWSPDGKYLASASPDCTVKVWDSATGTCKLTIEHHKAVYSVVWSPDGSKLASCPVGGTIMIWDVTTGEQIFALAAEDTPSQSVAAAWSPDGTQILSGSTYRGLLRVWDLATGKDTMVTEEDVDAGIHSVDWSPDGNFFATGWADGKIIIWDSATRKRKVVFNGHEGIVKELSWSPDGTQIMSLSLDLDIKIWDLATGHCNATFADSEGAVNSVSWSPDGIRFAVGLTFPVVKIRDVTHNEFIRLEGHRDRINSVAWFRKIKPLSPPKPLDPDTDDTLVQWMQDFMALQGRLHDLELVINGGAEQGVEAALDSIAKGLAEFNQLIDFWPDYTGDDTTNEKRKAIIKTATDLIQTGASMVTSAKTDDGSVAQLNDIDKELKEKKAQFTKETDAEQMELTSLRSDIQTAINKMDIDQKAYEEAQNLLLIKVEEVSLGTAVQPNASDKKNPILGPANDVVLPNGTGSLDDLQQAGELAYLILERAQNIVRYLQHKEQALRRIQKNRPFVQRAIARAERIIAVLRSMTQGSTNEEGDRLLAVVNLITPAMEKLGTVGEPPYRRPHRSTEDTLCTTILMIHEQSLIYEAFSDSARKAVAQVQDWFDDDIPKNAQKEIDDLVENPLYKKRLTS